MLGADSEDLEHLSTFEVHDKDSNVKKSHFKKLLHTHVRTALSKKIDLPHTLEIFDPPHPHCGAKTGERNLLPDDEDKEWDTNFDAENGKHFWSMSGDFIDRHHEVHRQICQSQKKKHSLQDKIISVRTQPTIPENPPAYDPQANGGAERGVQEVEGQLRPKFGSEARIGVEITETVAILGWMTPQAADTINRFLDGDDGRTAYSRVRHRNFHGKVYEFGEQVLAKSKRSNKKVKKKGALEPTFHDATWVGYNDRSNEHIEVLMEGGPAIKVRTVRPNAEGERWSAIAIKDIVTTPDMPNPKDFFKTPCREVGLSRGNKEKSVSNGMRFKSTVIGGSTTNSWRPG